jgi:hypothetical protein
MIISLKKKIAVLMTGMGLAAMAGAQPPPQVGTSTDSAHVFLNFSSGKNLAENPTTAKAYMAAIDPGGKKVNFVDWLVNAGFISKASEWKPSGQQVYTNVPGDYGYGKVNAFAHIIILNSADLGFIRNQYIRCIPDCKTRNAKIYTYLENYGATQVDSSGNQQTNNAKAVSIALERRGVVGAGHRIADVAFEWAPAANGTSPTTNFGQIYAYIVQPQFQSYTCGAGNSPTGVNPVLDASGNQVVDEQYIWPAGFNGANQQLWDCAFNTRPTPIPATSAQSPDATHIFYRNPPLDHKVVNGDPFAPELDSLGTKQMPGVCLICHGGNIPSTLATTQNWGPTGQINEFRFLPADAINSIFGENDIAVPDVLGAAGSDMTQAGQALELKKYNQAVVLTHGAVPPKTAVFLADGSIGGGQWSVGTSPDHAEQVIFGWYQGYDGDHSMSGGTNQNGNFVPVGWRTGPGGTNQFYTQVVQKDCRSCHLTREPSLDFSTQKQFDGNKGNVQNYVLQPECDYFKLNAVNPTNIVMPLARLTWERLWDGVNADNTTKFGLANTSSATDLTSDINLLKAHFGYTPTSYCAGQK